jgi:hypothetical protein
MKYDPKALCGLCSRPLGDERIQFHHLLPKSQGGKDTVPIHQICHRHVHATFTEKELEKRFHTWESLRAEEPIKVFIEWVKNKDPGLYIGSDETQARKGKRRR